MNRKFAAAAMVAAGLLFTAAFASAHHSIAANFDQNKAIDVVGQVKEVSLRLPGGKIEKWDCKPEEATFERFIPGKK